ncbi:DUF4465 domain-containing protein [Persicobacter diffluens]|uniref:DUF4465 domain-containing protein n=1 Tax=Persicobacter diffluens TaxID=981 RepID=A0AAN4VX45_9BACT|nr:hypothetical protein PEDI_16090 [Persicobacter diffluens]
MLKRTLLLMSLAATVVLSACNNDDDPVKDTVIDFSNLTLEEEETYWNGSDKSGDMEEEENGDLTYLTNLKSGIFNAPNQFTYTAAWDYWGWEGFAYSNQSDLTFDMEDDNDANFYNYQFVAAANYDKNYLIAYPQETNHITFDQEVNLKTITLTNTGTAYLVIKHGNAFSKPFGGESGDDPDYFKVIFTGKDAEGKETGVVEHFLADYRFEDNSQDYIQSEWEQIDVTGLGAVSQVEIAFESTDIANGGSQTPAYVAIGQLTY